MSDVFSSELFESVCLIVFKSTVKRTDVTMGDGDVVEAAAIGSPRIGAVVSEAGGQGEIWIYGRLIGSNRVSSISGEGWRISGLITCVTLHLIKIELSICNGVPGWNAGNINLHPNHIGNLVGWPSVEVESGAGNTDVRIDVQESVFTRKKIEIGRASCRERV